MRPANPPGGAPPKPTTPSPVSPAEPGDRVTLLMFTLEGGKMAPYGTLDVSKTSLDAIEEAIEKIASTGPRGDKIELGRPGSRLIVTAVDTKDPDHVGSSDDRFEVGEIVTIPEFVSFINIWFPKFSAPLVRYYTAKLHQPCTKCGYTVRALEDFLRDLKGPAARDFQEVADAHVAWAAQTRREPFK